MSWEPLCDVEQNHDMKRVFKEGWSEVTRIIWGWFIVKLNQNSGQQNEKDLEKWLSLPSADTGELLCDHYSLAMWFLLRWIGWLYGELYWICVPSV